MKPSFSEEKKLWKKGHKYVVGLDEAGRGALAGPVTAGAVMINPKFKLSKQFLNVNDSKKLSARHREEIYNAFKKHPDIKWGIGIVSEKIIDKINILEATKLAMKKAILNLEKKLEKKLRKKQVQNSHDRGNFAPVFFLIIDGNFKLNTNKNFRLNADFPQKAIVKADQKVFSCALASIFAKVTRDRIMRKYHKKYRYYGFGQHKGYGTVRHFEMLKKHGPCAIHRKSFYPVSPAKKSSWQ